MALVDRDFVDSEVPVIEAIQGGDRYAFSELVGRNQGWVRGVVFGVLGNQDRIDDVVQQVWTLVWQRINELRETNRWRPWIYRLARNAAVDAGRDTTRRRHHAQVLAAAAVAGGLPKAPDSGLDAKERHQSVISAIHALPALYREPFVMRHVNGWSYREISEVMGMPVDTVETRLVRARRLLRASLEDKV